MNKMPPARNRDIVVQEFDKEILVYDLRTHRMHNLNQTSAVVYRHCDGKTSFAELKRKNKFSDDLIHLALDQLREVNLIETDNVFVSPFAGMSRREAIRLVGLASMIALPLITSLMAPTAAMAQSGKVACTAGATGGDEGLGGVCICSPGSTAANPCVTLSPGCKAGCTCIGDGTCSGGPPCTGTCF